MQRPGFHFYKIRTAHAFLFDFSIRDLLNQKHFHFLKLESKPGGGY